MSELVLNSESSSDVSLVLDNENFAKVILDFLGKKETLNYSEEVNFELRLNDVEQFYYLIDEKMKREHNFFIDHFTVTFFL